MYLCQKFVHANGYFRVLSPRRQRDVSKSGKLAWAQAPLTIVIEINRNSELSELNRIGNNVKFPFPRAQAKSSTKEKEIASMQGKLATMDGYIERAEKAERALNPLE